MSPRSLAALPASIQPGDLVAVVVADDPPSRRVVAVGHLGGTRDDVVRMQLSGAEKKGKAVVTLHARGDYLWAAGSGVDAPLPPPPPSSASSSSSSKSAPAARAPEVDDLAENLASSSLAPASAKVLRPEATPPASASASASASAELTPAEVDATLLDALLLAISTTLSSSATFPLPASLLYSSHILPSRPASGPGATAEVKKGSFKKLDRLVKAAAKKGWLATKEVKGEVVVVGVNAAHPDVEALRPYRTLGMEDRAEARREKRDGDEVERRKGEVEVRELWKLSGDGAKELFRHVEHERCAFSLPLSLGRRVPSAARRCPN